MFISSNEQQLQQHFDYYSKVKETIKKSEQPLGFVNDSITQSLTFINTRLETLKKAKKNFEPCDFAENNQAYANILQKINTELFHTAVSQWIQGSIRRTDYFEFVLQKIQLNSLLNSSNNPASENFFVNVPLEELPANATRSTEKTAPAKIATTKEIVKNHLFGQS